MLNTERFRGWSKLPETERFRWVYIQRDVTSCRVDLHSSACVIDHVVRQNVTSIRVMTQKVEGQGFPSCSVKGGAYCQSGNRVFCKLQEVA